MYLLGSELSKSTKNFFLLLLKLVKSWPEPNEVAIIKHYQILARNMHKKVYELPQNCYAHGTDIGIAEPIGEIVGLVLVFE